MISMKYTIRQATRDDFSAIEAVLRESFQGEEANESVSQLRKKLVDGHPNFLSFVAIARKDIVGHAAVTVETPPEGVPIAAFSLLTVQPSHRGYGIGQALLTKRIEAIERSYTPCVGVSNATTAHTRSQENLVREGFFPVRITAYGDKMGIGYSRLFCPAPYNAALVHFSDEESYEEKLVCTVLTFMKQVSHTSVTLQHGTQRQTQISSRLEKWFTQAPTPNSVYPLRLYEECAAAEITTLRENGYYANGVLIKPAEKTTSITLYFMKLPYRGLVREGIHILPQVQPLFDLVQKEYSERMQ